MEDLDRAGAGMRSNWEPLAWDSAFFGFPIVRILPSTPAEELPLTITKLRAEGIELAYWILDEPDESRSRTAEGQGGLLVDEKTTFLGRIGEVLEVVAAGPHVSEFSGSTEALKELALVSGQLSRFRLDPHLSTHHFERLYSVWLERSVNREIAREVFVTGTAAAPTGFVTVSEKNGRADIGLIAVVESARGSGCGRALVRAAAQWGRDSGLQSLQVVTQGQNTAATQLYRRCGMSLETMRPVFHFWPQKEPQP